MCYQKLQRETIMTTFIALLILVSHSIFAMEQDDGLWIPPQQEEQKIVKNPSDTIMEKVVLLSSAIQSLKNTEPNEEQKTALFNHFYELNEQLKNADKETGEFVQRYLEKSGTHTIWTDFAKKQEGDFGTQVSCYYGDLNNTLYPNNRSTIVEDTIKKASHLFPADHVQKWQKRIKRKNSKIKKKNEQRINTLQVPTAIEISLPIFLGEPELPEDVEQNDNIDDENDLPDEIKQQLAQLALERSIQNQPEGSTQSLVSKKSKKKKTKPAPQKKETVEKSIVQPVRKLGSSSDKPIKLAAKKGMNGSVEKVPKEKKTVTWQEQFGNAKVMFNNDPFKGISELERIIKEGEPAISFHAACFLAELYDPLKPTKKDIKKNARLSVDWYKKAREHGKVTAEMACNALLSAVAMQDTNETTAWLQQCEQTGVQNSILAWVQGIHHLLANRQDKAASFFVGWDRKKDMVKPEMYDLLFEPVNKWFATYFEQLNIREQPVSDYEQAIILYSLAKMFTEGSSIWQEQAKKGWAVPVEDHTKTVRLFPVQIMRQAAVHYIPAAYYLGMQPKFTNEQRMPYLKQIVDAPTMQLNNPEQEIFRATLKNIAYQGDCAAAMALAKDAYKRQRLLPWLNQHKQIAAKLYMTEWMGPLLYEHDKEFLSELRKVEHENTLARVLLMSHAFAQYEQKIMNCEAPEEIHDLLKTLPDMLSSYKDLATNCIVRFEQGLRGLAHHALRHKFEQPITDEVCTFLDKKFMATYALDDYSAYIYMRFLISEWNMLANNEKKKIFAQLTKQLATSPEYQLHAYEALSAFYLDLKDWDGVEFYLGKIEEHPGYWLNQKEIDYVNDVRQILLKRMRETATDVIPESEDVRELRTAQKMLDTAAKACDQRDFHQAAVLLYKAVKKYNLLKYFQGTLSFNREIFDRIIAVLQLQEEDAIQDCVAQINENDVGYNATLNHEAIKKEKSHLMAFKELLEEYKKLESSRNFKKWMVKVRAHPMIYAALQEKGYKDKDKIEPEQLFDEIKYQCVMAQSTLDNLVGLGIKDKKIDTMQQQILHNVCDQAKKLPPPITKYDETNLHKIAETVLTAAEESCQKSNFKGVAIVLRQAIERKMMLQCMESAFNNKKIRFDTIMDKLRQQDNPEIKDAVTAIDTHIMQYHEKLDQQAIQKAKDRCITIYNLYAQYLQIAGSSGKQKNYIALLSQMMKEIPNMLNDVLVLDTTDEQEMSSKIFHVLSQATVRAENDLKLLVGLPLNQHNAEINYQVSSQPSSRKVIDQPADPTVVNAYKVLKQGQEVLNALISIQRAEKVIATLEKHPENGDEQ